MSGRATVPNWYEIPEIKADVDHFASMRADGNERIANVGSMLRSQPDQELWLKVKVSDVDLAQVVLSSMYGPNGSFIPGLELTSIHFNGSVPADVNDPSQFLRQLADKLDEQKDAGHSAN